MDANLINEAKPESDRIVAVIVTYQPDIPELSALLDALRNQVNSIVIVDNGSRTDLSNSDVISRPNVHLVQNGSNLGVAEGQNRGIEWARTQDANYVILFDQDSLPGEGMVPTLLNFARRKVMAGERLGAVGPTNLDGRWNKLLPFVVVKNGRYRRLVCEPTEESVKIDHVISSGALIPMKTLDEIGLMRSELFIDYIDIEWCLRARAHDFSIYGLRDARMIHSLGNTVVTLGSFKLSMHSPARDYYFFRNAIWMMRQNWISFSWKWAEGTRLVTRFALYTLFGKPRVKQIKFMIRGITDGLRGKSGEFQP
jgi:rhamnosyltransferase